MHFAAELCICVSTDQISHLVGLSQNTIAYDLKGAAIPKITAALGSHDNTAVGIGPKVYRCSLVRPIDVNAIVTQPISASSVLVTRAANSMGSGGSTRASMVFVRDLDCAECN
jgi:hypothetical protein